MRKLLNILSVTGIVLCLVFASAVYALTQSRSITGEGFQTGGTYVGGAVDFTNLNSDDGDVSYISQSGSFVYHSWQFQDFTSTDSINSVTLYTKARVSATTPSLYDVVWVGGTPFLGTNRLLTTTYITYSTTWATNPATGLAWTMAEVNAAEFGSYFGHTGPTESRITYMYLVVDYTLLPPDVETDAATGITYSGTHDATLNGEVTSESGSNVTERGFVWDTSSHIDPGNTTPPATYSNNWSESSASWGTGTFNHQITGLVAGTTYYFRAFAQNSVGYDYGDDEESFVTLDTPSVTTQSATYVAASSATLNALLVDDGNEACDVRFGYDNVSHAGAFTYGSTTTWENNTYTSGQTISTGINGLTPGVTYYYNAQVCNTFVCVIGSEMTFTADTGVAEPSSFQAKPEATAVDLTWVSGAGSSRTMIRYKTGTYPTDITDGTQAHFDIGSSAEATGLTRGVTYYFSAWGESGGLYSVAYATSMATTLASEPSLVPLVEPVDATTGDLGPLFQEPDVSAIASMPFYDLGNAVFDSYSLPRATGWVLGWFVGGIILGLFLYSKSHQPVMFPIGLLFMVAIGALVAIMPGWIAVPSIIICMSIIVLGWRA